MKKSFTFDYFDRNNTKLFRAKITAKDLTEARFLAGEKMGDPDINNCKYIENPKGKRFFERKWFIRLFGEWNFWKDITWSIEETS